MRIGVCGAGIVGNAIARSYIEHHDVRVYDVVKEKATHTKEQTLDCDIVFLALPTPQRLGSLECNTDYLVEFFESLPNEYKNTNFVIRSTVPIGFTKKTKEFIGLSNLVHSPEFLTARCAVTDAQIPARNIIGIPQSGKVWKEWSICSLQLRELYTTRFPGVPVLEMTSDESEAVKLFQNSFFATKIAFMNEINLLSQRLGLDWDTVLQGMLSDGRIAHSHTKVPGPDGKYGFGPDTPNGCLQKDIANLVYTLGSSGLYPHVTGGVRDRNVEDRKRV